MITFPIARLNKLLINCDVYSIEDYIQAGLFTCIHTSGSPECLYTIDTCILKPVALLEFYERYIKLLSFYGSHVYIEDDEIERSIEITDFDLILYDNEGKPSKWFKDWSEELHNKYFKYIKELINNHNIEYKLYRVLDEINEEDAHKNYRDYLERVLDQIADLEQAADKIINQLEINYPIEFGLGVNND